MKKNELKRYMKSKNAYMQGNELSWKELYTYISEERRDLYIEKMNS